MKRQAEAKVSRTSHDQPAKFATGWRYTALVTNTPPTGTLQCWRSATVPTPASGRIRRAKGTGLRRLPARESLSTRRGAPPWRSWPT